MRLIEAQDKGERYSQEAPLPCRITVVRVALNHEIGVRFPAGQHSGA